MFRFRQVLGLSAAILAVGAPAASAGTQLNIVPHGQGPGAGAPEWLSAPGMLPVKTQAEMYDRLTPLFRNLPSNVLDASANGTGYFKSAALVPQNDASLIYSESVSGQSGSGKAVSATIKRDAYGVPHIYSSTDDGVIFGAGYALATDRSALLTLARTNGVASLIDIPGVEGIRLILGLYDYQPTQAILDQVTRQQDSALKAAGPQGLQVLRDIDTYVAGINAWYAKNSPSTKPFSRTDIYAFNGVKAQFLGQGGGEEIPNALFLQGARDKLGSANGDRAYRDMRGRYDPETMTSTSARFDYQTDVSVSRPRGMVRLKNDSFSNRYVPLPGATASASAAATASRRQEASNIILAAGSKSRTGRPLLVGGPQIGYNYPGLTLEMDLQGPNIKVRGATSAPFPGYMLIGRGEKYAWSLTSAGNDIQDTYAETLCGGSELKYLYKGKCRDMTRVEGGKISKGGVSTDVVFYRTVHGPVQGYATVQGTDRKVALARKRSSYGRETTDLLFNQQMTFGRVKSAKDFVKAAQKTPQTFNSFYASDREIAFYTSGRFPIRPRGVNPDLPVDGRGGYEWTGYQAKSRQPHVINPKSGYIVNWNNKPAKDFPAGDERWGEQSLQRGLLLTNELARQKKQTAKTLLSASNAGATQDVRIALLWPTLRKMLAKGSAPSALATQAARQLDIWRTQGSSRVDSNQDGKIDAPGAAVIDATWSEMAHAAMCSRLGAEVCKQLEGRNGGDDAFDQPNGGQYNGWHQYMWKDLRRLLGENVRGAYGLKYCGRGNVKTCAADLWKAFQAGVDRVAAEQGSDPAAWRKSEGPEEIKFTPLPLITMDYTNRPSGIHQVMDFSR